MGEAVLRRERKGGGERKGNGGGTCWSGGWGWVGEQVVTGKWQWTVAGGGGLYLHYSIEFPNNLLRWLVDALTPACY